jgi:hypothetical protein
MPARPVAPRLHVLLASHASTAVVVRRGPTRHTALIGWDRNGDRFTVGQWLYGRIYERRSDISPDGRHVIYFAMNGRWSSAAKGAWTAISRAPYLKAVSLFAKGDCWHGGDLFRSRTDYWLNDGYGHQVLQEDRTLRRVTDHPWHESYGGECQGVYFIRLQRDGWAMKSTAPDGAGGNVTCFEKPVAGHWHLRKLAHATLHHPVGKGVYYDTHELFNKRTGASVPLPDWEWAEVDGKRLLWAAGGCIHAGRVDAAGLKNAMVLHDFNGMQFEPLAAPY